MNLTHPPVARKVPTERLFHGDSYTDNFEWFRDKASPEVIDHLNAENAWTSQNTAHLGPLTEKIVGELAARTQESDIGVPQRDGDWWYLRRTWEGKQYPAVYRVPALTELRPSQAVLQSEAGEQLVYDGNSLAEGQEFFATSEFVASPNGKLGALGVDFLGDEHFTLRIFDIESGMIVDDSVAGLGYGLAWTADSSGVVYARVDDAWRTYQVWLHTVGTTSESDRLLYEEPDEQFEIWHVPSRDGQWIVINSASRTTSEVRLVSTHQPLAAPILVCPRTHGLEYSVEPANDHLLIIHNANFADFELATAPIRTAAPFEWVSILEPEPGERILDVDAFRDFAVISMRSGGQTALRVTRRLASCHDLKEGPVGYKEPHERPIWERSEPVPAEPLHTIEFYQSNDWEAQDIAFTSESTLTPPRTSSYRVETGEVRVLKELPTPNYDSSAYVQEGVLVTAADGTPIPLTIVRRRDVKPDGTNPGYIYGYGSYEVSNDPQFWPGYISLLDRGVVVAWTHVRGGGEMGREWYDNGKMMAKKNTFTDFVDCSRWLISSGWVNVDRLAAEGRSAGGLLMGAVVNLDPSLYRAVHAGVPFVDALTTMLKPELPLTAGEWEEWGNPITEKEAYEYMKSYAPTENVQAVQYPAILATTSLNDVRVSYVEPTKWVQILRETTKNQSGRPILEKIEMVAGHGGKRGRYDKWRQQAFILAWLLDQIGAAEQLVEGEGAQ